MRKKRMRIAQIQPQGLALPRRPAGRWASVALAAALNAALKSDIVTPAGVAGGAEAGFGLETGLVLRPRMSSTVTDGALGGLGRGNSDGLSSAIATDLWRCR